MLVTCLPNTSLRSQLIVLRNTIQADADGERLPLHFELAPRNSCFLLHPCLATHHPTNPKRGNIINGWPPGSTNFGFSWGFALSIPPPLFPCNILGWMGLFHQRRPPTSPPSQLLTPYAVLSSATMQWVSHLKEGSRAKRYSFTSRNGCQIWWDSWSYSGKVVRESN